MATIAFIPVRGGSKSIPQKNTKLLGGRPLLHWTLEAAVSAQCIDEVVVSSDSERILEVARAYGHPKVKAVRRPAEFATDIASTEAAMLDYASKNAFEYMVLVQATSPLTTSQNLDEAFQIFKNSAADSLLTVTHEHRFRWKILANERVEAENYQPAQRPRRQDWSGELIENGAFYISTRLGLLDSGCRLHGEVAHYVMPPQTAVEIDTPKDWCVLEALIQQHTAQMTPAPQAQDIRLLITDVDGVLTDAGMYYGAEGEVLKKFNTRDGMGTAIWRNSGREIAIITGENSAAVARRAEKLAIEETHLGVKDKLPLVQSLADARGLELSQVAYIGDDINDFQAMSAVGITGCPQDAHSRIQGIAHFVSLKKGGEGCLREFIEWLLSRSGQRDVESSDVAACRADT